MFVSPQSVPTSVKCSPSGQKAVVGTDDGGIRVFDIDQQREVGTLSTHANRVCCLSFNDENVVTSGSQDTLIMTHDLRQQPGSSALVFKHHTQEVCSLAWDGRSTYLASGGNENAVYVWDVRRDIPVKSYREHRAAVRALCWSPHQFGMLLSGGGNIDESVKFWNVIQPGEASSDTLHTGSQVCNIVVSSHSNEMLTTHGFSKNQLMLWNIPKRERFAVLDAHATRVLYCAYGPDGESVATCSADLTLKFWRVFLRQKQPLASDKSPLWDRGSFSFR